MQHLEGSGTPVLYIGRTVLKGQKDKLLTVSLMSLLIKCLNDEFVIQK